MLMGKARKPLLVEHGKLSNGMAYHIYREFPDGDAARPAYPIFVDEAHIKTLSTMIRAQIAVHDFVESMNVVILEKKRVAA